MEVYKGYLKIETLSDLCASDGDVYSSLIDTDVCADSKGFPYIPAKRIKGIMRESAFEFCNADVKAMFGEKGDKSSRIAISNAKVEGHDENMAALNEVQLDILKHPQTILNYYTYMRTQTAIDSETGVAVDNSLRTIRVVKKGTVFKAEIEIKCDGEWEKYNDELERICKGMRHMGLNRTRGLGEIQVSLEGIKKKDNNTVKYQDNYDENSIYRIPYTVYLKSPLVLKSVIGGQARTMHYIEGAKILGALAQGMTNDDFQNFTTESDIICSNAYVSMNGNRSFPVPNCYYKKKDQKKEDGKLLLLNKAVKDSSEQASPYGEGYCFELEDKCYKIDVKSRIGYYHERPEDKSIGHADDTAFYQMEMLTEGQEFSGFIEVKGNSVNKVRELLSGLEDYRMGYGRQAEFGSVTIKENGEVKKADNININTAASKKYVIELLSSVILYDKASGMYATDINVLRDAIAEKLNISINNDSGNPNFIQYETLGGYNVMWNAKKPTIRAFGKGSVLVINTDSDITEGKFWIGERCREGYGELRIRPLGENDTVELYDNKVSQNPGSGSSRDNVISNAFVSKLAKKELEKDIRMRARKEAFEEKDAYESPAISKAIIVYSEQDSLDDFYAQMKEITDVNKKNIAVSCKKRVETLEATIRDNDYWRYLTNVDIDDINNNNLLYKWYVNSWLLELKYNCRERRMKAGE
ncbi:MAG: hypothetical protein K6G26_04750 [Lachnospiraceae bacterium]|nr:hypothetical protein [Lachnospiraceae bacterium]